jgi:hypothetical protein
MALASLMSAHFAANESEELAGIWTHEQAKRKAPSQLKASGCGATAALTVLIALGHSKIEHEIENDEALRKQVIENVVLRVRDYDAPLPQYLVSRSVAGCTGQEIVDGVHICSSSSLCGRFYALKGKTNAGTLSNLGELMARGDVAAVATFNLQKLGNDAWHHQFVYAVDVANRRLWCTNSIQCYDEALALELLDCEPLMLVRRSDALTRIDRPGADESLYVADERWRELDVAGQVEQMRLGTSTRRHVTVPAIYESGVSLFVHVSNRHLLHDHLFG